jgi:sensor histidine kinase YesM
MASQTGFIPPLLLLPFVENCFKHGTIGREDEGWIELDIWDDKGRFFFVCKNSCREDKKQGQMNGTGLGLTNVRKRLDLIFGENYELKIVKQEDEYMVSLRFPVFLKKEEL